MCRLDGLGMGWGGCRRRRPLRCLGLCRLERRGDSPSLCEPGNGGCILGCSFRGVLFKVKTWKCECVILVDEKWVEAHFALVQSSCSPEEGFLKLLFACNEGGRVVFELFDTCTMPLQKVRKTAGEMQDNVGQNTQHSEAAGWWARSRVIFTMMTYRRVSNKQTK